jgi:hypothetical protein
VAEALAAEEDARVRAVEAARAEAAAAQEEALRGVRVEAATALNEAVKAAQAEAAAALEKAVATAREEEVARGSRLIGEAETRASAAREALESRIKTLDASLEYARKIAEERAEAFAGEPLHYRLLPFSPF